MRLAELIRTITSCRMDIHEMDDKSLRRLFEQRKKALLEVRDEIDRREKGSRPAVAVDFTKYVGDGIE